MKKFLVILCIFFLVSCEDTSELEYKLSRLENLIESVQVTQDGLRETLDIMFEETQNLEDDLVLQNDFDVEQAEIIAELHVQPYHDRVGYIERVINTFSEQKYYFGKFIDNKFYVYELPSRDPFQSYTEDDLIKTDMIIDLIAIDRTEFLYHYGEGLTKEEFLKLITPEDYFSVNLINNYILYIYNEGPLEDAN